jgi:hypothetical protein
MSFPRKVGFYKSAILISIGFLIFMLYWLLNEPLNAQAQINIKIMEFNIEEGGTLVSFDKIVEAIKAASPDIIGIEEACGNLGQLAQKLAYPYYDTRGHIISRFPIIDPPGADGTYVFIEIQPNKIIAISNVHLPSDPYGPHELRVGVTFEQISQLENKLRLGALEKELQVLPELVKSGIPVFLIGDFNVPSHLDCKQSDTTCFPWPISIKLAKLGFRDAYRDLYPDQKLNPGFTWWANRPKVSGWNSQPTDIPDRIDFIYTAGNSQTLEATLLGEVGAQDVTVSVSPWPSDHRAIVSSFSVVPANLPTLVSVDKRLIETGDEINIRYALADENAKQLAIKSMADNQMIFKYDLKTRRDTVRYQMDKLSGPFEAVLIDANNNVIHQVPFFVKPKGSQMVLTTKKFYQPNEPIICQWQNAPGNRSDWIGIRNIKDASDETKLHTVHTNAKITGTISFNKDNVETWPLSPGEYEMLYMIDESYHVATRETFSVTH